MLAGRGAHPLRHHHGQRVGKKLQCEWVTSDNPDPPEAETEPATVWRDGHSKGAAQFIGVEGCHWSKGNGKWLFVHLQYPGRTFAITGPWETGWG
jgi:uncharacterized protein